MTELEESELKEYMEHSFEDRLEKTKEQLASYVRHKEEQKKGSGLFFLSSLRAEGMNEETYREIEQQINRQA